MQRPRPVPDDAALTPLDAEPGAPPADLPAPPPRRTFVGALVVALLALGAVAVVLAAVPSRVFDLERYLAPKELALDATALLLLLVLLPRRSRLHAGGTGTLLLAYVAWSAVSAVLATNRWLALDALGVSFSGVVVFLAARRAASEERGWAVLVALALATAVAAALGIAQAYGVDWRIMADSRPPGGTFGNRNFLAHLAVIALPVLLLLTLRARRVIAAGIGLLTVAADAEVVVLTRSRAAWLALGATLAVMLFATLAGRRRALSGVLRRRAVVALLVLGAAVAAAIAVPNALRWRSDSPYAETLTSLTNYREGSGHGRLIQYRNSLRMLGRRPVFGVGPGNWFVHYPRVTTPGDPSFAGYDPIPTNPWPSSDWIAILTERGAVGLALLFLAGIAAATASLRRLRDPDGDVAARAVALLGVLTATLVTGAFDAVLLLAAPTFFVAAAAGVLLPAAEQPQPEAERAPPRRAIGVVALVLALAFTVGAGGRVAALAIARPYRRSTLEAAARLAPGSHRLQILLSRSGSCRQRLPHARAARRLLPYHSAPRQALRECGVEPGRAP